MFAKTRIPRRAAAALCALVALCATQLAMAQEADDCPARVQTLAETHGVPLRVVLSRLGDEARAASLKWADCASGHLGLAMVYEQAIRAADTPAQADQGHALYISPSQQVKVADPEGAFARSQLVARINAVPEARALAAPLLGPPAGAATWSATLADLNAETHALRAATALARAKLLTPQEAALQARQTATALLITTAYVHHAQQDQPAVFGRLAAAPESVDALGVLTARAIEALTAASRLGADPDTDAILKGLEPHAAAMEALFKQAGLQAPALAIPKAPAAPVAQANDTPPAPQADNKPGGDAPDAGAGNAPVANDAPDAGLAPTPADAPDAGGANAGNADAGNAGAPPAPGAPPQEEGLSTAHQVRIGLGALGLLLPWLLIGIIALTKRRKPAFYQRLANRTVAIATLLMVFEALGLLLAGVMGTLGAMLTLDALFLLFAPYMLAVSVLMLARLDTEDQLASRQLFKRWGKWMAVGFGVILVANAVLIPTIFVLTPHFIVLPSMLVVALVAIVFLIKLWRTGDAPEAPPQPAPDAGEPEAGPPEAKKPETRKPETKTPEVKKPEAKQPEARTPEARKPEAPAPRPAPARPTDPGDEGDVDAPDPDSKAAQMSDDELLKALEGFGAPSASAPRKPAHAPSDRKRPQMSNDDLLKAFEGLEGTGNDGGGGGDTLSDEERARLQRLLDD